MSQQIVLASPISAGVASGGNGQLIATANEGGVLHLSQSILTSHQQTNVAASGFDLSELIEITAIQINGSTFLERGRGALRGSNFLSPHRKGNLAALPDITVASGDTITLNYTYVYAGNTADSFFGIPFTPARFAQTVQPAMGLNEVWTASPAVAVAGAANTPVVLTCSDDGILDMSRIAFQYSLTPTANLDGHDGVHAAWNASITGLNVAGRYNMIVSGAGVAAAPMGMFALGRSTNWVDLGKHKVSAGDLVTANVQINASGGVNGQVSFGVPQFTGQGMGNLGACSPCG